ncbi:hypothetical protein JCM15519_18870 [Fundidesulfovibrio butyratiphilus]
MTEPFTRLEKTAYRLVMAVLAVTGMAQMPIFKRYRIADVPGLGWTADFFFTHWLHILGAAALLFLLGRLAGRGGLLGLGRVRGGFLAVLVGTGVVRLAKNLPGVSFDPTTTMLIDWIHLGAAIGLGIAALAALAVGLGGRPGRKAPLQEA